MPGRSHVRDPMDSSGIFACMGNPRHNNVTSNPHVDKPHERCRSGSPSPAPGSPRKVVRDKLAEYGFGGSRRKNCEGSPLPKNRQIETIFNEDITENPDKLATRKSAEFSGLFRRAARRNLHSVGTWACLRGGSLPPNLDATKVDSHAPLSAIPARYGGHDGPLFARDPEYGLTRRGARRQAGSPGVWSCLQKGCDEDYPLPEEESSVATRPSSEPPRRVRKPPQQDSPTAQQRWGTDMRKCLERTPPSPRRSCRKSGEVSRTNYYSALFDEPRSSGDEPSLFTRSTSPGGSQGESIYSLSSSGKTWPKRHGKAATVPSQSMLISNPVARISAKREGVLPSTLGGGELSTSTPAPSLSSKNLIKSAPTWSEASDSQSQECSLMRRNRSTGDLQRHRAPTGFSWPSSGDAGHVDGESHSQRQRPAMSMHKSNSSEEVGRLSLKRPPSPPTSPLLLNRQEGQLNPLPSPTQSPRLFHRPEVQQHSPPNSPCSSFDSRQQAGGWQNVPLAPRQAVPAWPLIIEGVRSRSASPMPSPRISPRNEYSPRGRLRSGAVSGGLTPAQVAALAISPSVSPPHEIFKADVYVAPNGTKHATLHQRGQTFQRAGDAAGGPALGGAVTDLRWPFQRGPNSNSLPTWQARVRHMHQTPSPESRTRATLAGPPRWLAKPVSVGEVTRQFNSLHQPRLAPQSK